MKIKVKDIVFRYKSDPVLKNVCLDIKDEFLCIVGPNGAGKSTLIKCIARLLKYKGEIILDNEKELKKLKRIELSKRISYLPQKVSTSFGSITALDVVIMGRYPHRQWHWIASKEEIEKALEVMKMLNIEHLATRPINEMSGGQQQKVFIAKALAQETDIILLDEPTSNLDIRHQIEVMETLSNLVKEKELCVIAVIHDLNLASRYADKIVILKDGQIVGAGKPEEVITPENIRKVYGVEAIVGEKFGKPYMIPVKIAD